MFVVSAQISAPTAVGGALRLLEGFRKAELSYQTVSNGSDSNQTICTARRYASCGARGKSGSLAANVCLGDAGFAGIPSVRRVFARPTGSYGFWLWRRGHHHSHRSHTPAVYDNGRFSDA